MKENYVEKKWEWFNNFHKIVYHDRDRKNVLLNMIKWSIGWQYVDILNMVVKICNLLSLIMDGISINRLWHRHTFKYIVEKTMFKHKPNFFYVL